MERNHMKTTDIIVIAVVFAILAAVLLFDMWVKRKSQ
jgi:hypothetical protein